MKSRLAGLKSQKRELVSRVGCEIKAFGSIKVKNVCLQVEGAVKSRLAGLKKSKRVPPGREAVKYPVLKIISRKCQTLVSTRVGQWAQSVSQFFYVGGASVDGVN